MSAGLPVVAYDCIAGPSDMINDSENGFLIPVFNDELFLSKLEMLINNDDLRILMAENAIESIKKFDQKTISEKYLDFILN